jgi:hypothetical protein
MQPAHSESLVESSVAESTSVESTLVFPVLMMVRR